MLIVIKFLAKVLTILNSEESPQQLAAGFSFGVMLGLVPVMGILPALLLVFAFLININLSLMFLAAAIFKILAYALDPLANQIGYFLLVKIVPLRTIWTFLYNLPLIPYTKFNNTLVLGSFVIGLLLLVPMYFLGRWGVTQYRTTWKARIDQTRFMQFVKASTLYQWYLTFQKVNNP